MKLVRFEPRAAGPICDAIRTRHHLAFDYGGGERVVEPHIHGTNAADDEVLRGYQLSGPSKGGHAQRWRLFIVSRMTAIRVLDAEFKSTRNDFNPKDPDVRYAHCRVSDS